MTATIRDPFFRYFESLFRILLDAEDSSVFILLVRQQSRLIPHIYQLGISLQILLIDLPFCQKLALIINL
jgi:hypothetical protein